MDERRPKSNRVNENYYLLLFFHLRAVILSIIFKCNEKIAQQKLIGNSFFFLIVSKLDLKIKTRRFLIFN